MLKFCFMKSVVRQGSIETDDGIRQVDTPAIWTFGPGLISAPDIECSVETLSHERVRMEELNPSRSPSVALAAPAND